MLIIQNAIRYQQGKKQLDSLGIAFVIDVIFPFAFKMEDIIKLPKTL
ncbi:hypothetical protein J2T13_000489 [Paenibacillus sp. DS2015]